jgi:hypothetical protein
MSTIKRFSSHVAVTLDAVRYAVLCPWDSQEYSLNEMAADPDTLIRPWCDSKNLENGLIGLVVTNAPLIIAPAHFLPVPTLP